MPTTFNRFAGCLIGQCLGDALGFPVEGHAPDVCNRYVETNLLVYPPKFIGRAEKFPFGQYTDDSQLARELLISFRNCSGLFSPQDYAERIAALFERNEVVGCGRATAEAARRIRAGVGWERSGAPTPAPGNGSAMRAAPIGLITDQIDVLIEAAHQQSWITHQDPRCSAGAVVIAGAVAWLRREDSDHTTPESTSALNPAALVTALADWALPFDPVLAETIRKLPDWSSLPPDQAVKRIACRPQDVRYYNEWWGISPYVTESVLWSLYSFLHTPEDYWRTICTAIRVGGDVDTTAAMAGALSGAYLGLSNIPAAPARLIIDRGQWGYDEMLALIDAIVDILLPRQGNIHAPRLPRQLKWRSGMGSEWIAGFLDEEQRLRHRVRSTCSSS